MNILLTVFLITALLLVALPLVRLVKSLFRPLDSSPDPRPRKTSYIIPVRFRELAALLIVAFLVAMSPTRASAQLSALHSPFVDERYLRRARYKLGKLGFSNHSGKVLHVCLGLQEPRRDRDQRSIDPLLNGSITGTNWTTTFPISLTASTHLGGTGTNREVFTLPATNGALIKQFSFLRVEINSHRQHERRHLPTS
jgi:hypothetical protein